MILSATILLLILLPIIASMVLSLLSVQNRIINVLTTQASEYLGTEVSIGEIAVTMRGNVELSDFLVRDLQGDSLIYVSRLETSFSSYLPISKRLRLGHSVVESAKVHIKARKREDGKTIMNIKELSEMLVNRESPSRMELSLASVTVDGAQLKIEQLESKSPEYGVDLRDLELNNICGAVSELSLSGSSLHTYVERLSAEEQSGFDIYNISGEFYLTDGAIALSNAQIESRWSALKIPYASLIGRSWGDYREFERSVTLDLQISDGAMASDDIAYFAPMLRGCGVELRDMELTAEGEIDDLLVTIYNINYGEATRLNATAAVEGLSQGGEMARWAVELGDLRTAATDLDMLKWSFTRSGFSDRTMAQIEALGSVALRGSISGKLNDLYVDGSMFSEIGEVNSSMRVAQEDGVRLEGEVRIEQMELGKVVGEEALGAVTMALSVDGVVDGATSRGEFSSVIDTIEWSGRKISDINIEGQARYGGVPSLSIVSRDPNLMFDFSGSAHPLFAKEATPRYLFDLNLHKANLTALDINRRDLSSQLSCRVEIDGEGRNVEQCRANLKITDGQYLYNTDTLAMREPAELRILSREGERLVEFESEYLDGIFTSHSSVADITHFLRNALSRYLPATYDSPNEMFHTELIPSQDSSDYSYISLSAKDLNSIFNTFSEGFVVGEGTSLNGRFDPVSQNIEGQVESPFFEHGTTIAVALRAEAMSRGDSLVMTSSIDELLVGTSLIEDAALWGSVRDNRIDLSSEFHNPADSASAELGAVVRLQRNATNSDYNTKLRILPSTLKRRKEVWQMRSGDIDISRQGVDINQFRVESRNQLMTINGCASATSSDTLRMDLQDFDLSIFSTLISQLGYQIEGRTSGQALISSALYEARLDAMVDLDSVSVNTLAAPPMTLSAEWDSASNQARLHLSNRVTRDTLVRGYYVPSEVRYYAKLEVDSLHMGVLDPPLGGVITDTKGFADLDITLQGKRRNANLDGAITIYDVATTVDYTKVRYRLPRAVVRVQNNIMNCTDARVEDGVDGGGSASMELQVDLKHLSNIEYSMRILPDKMLVLNTTERDNDTFYGRLFASGAATIVGDKSGVKMNISASTDDDSHFFMPLQNKANISTADFITFVQPVKRDTTNLLHSRMMLNEQKRNRRGSGTMSLDMALDVQPNTELQLVIDPTVGDIIRARGEGRLNLNIDPKSNIFDIYGDYSITEGNYLFTLRNIVNKRFVIDPGSTIRWTGSPIDPLLDINAIYQLKASLEPLISDESTRAVPVNCIINLSDRLTQPDVTFAIELPSSDPEQQAVLANTLNDQEAISRQFFYLMLANSFIPEASSGGTGDLGVSTTAATGFELLTNQLSNWLSTSNYNVIIRYRPESELAGDEVDIGFSKGLINNRLIVELEGNYIIDNKQAITEDASNFMGEAYITWLIDYTGALKLKGFTQTIDTYDENQGLQETGIGIYYRENFDNFKDLRERVKARFRASEERLEQRAERRAARKGEQESELEDEQEDEQTIKN